MSERANADLTEQEWVSIRENAVKMFEEILDIRLNKVKNKKDEITPYMEVSFRVPVRNHIKEKPND